MIAAFLAALLVAQAEPAPAPVAAPSIDLSVSIEPQEVHLADRAVLVVTAKHPETVRLFFPEQIDLDPFRTLGKAVGPERVQEGDMLVETWRVPIAPMRLGRRKVPPFPIQYEDALAETGEVLTPPIAVNVMPRLDMAQDQVPLKGNAGPLQLFDTNWTLILLLVSLAVITITSLITLVAVRYVADLPRRGPPPPPPRPAHEVTAERLVAIEDEKLLPTGQLKAFTFRVSEALREYLGLRWDVDTLELTTRELLDRMRAIDPQGLSFYELEDFLATTDLVKFAGLTPTHIDCQKTRDAVTALVEKTRRTDDEVRKVLAAHEARVKATAPASWQKRLVGHGIELVAVGTGLYLLGTTLHAARWTPLGIGLLLTAIWAGFVLTRDLWHRKGLKRILGLQVVSAPDAPPLDAGALMARNLTLLFPLIGHTVELIVMIYAADGRRIGDRMGGTRIKEARG
ncbi:MAG: hypothetical protein ACI9WU_003518 [Myxococcota bacterium]